jgi:TonB family protein
MKFYLLQLSVLLCCLLVSRSFAQEITTEIKAPKAISFPEPLYGDSVKQYGFKGVVSVYVHIDKAGKVSVIGAFGPASPCSDLKSPNVLAIRNAAMDAAAKSVFETPLKDGKPTEANVYLTYKFTPIVDEAIKDSVKITSVPGGILNGRAKSLPKPYYPATAGANRVGGLVTTQVLVSEGGEVITAAALSGHPSLREAAVEAACKAQFAPLTLQGNPVRVSGLITYNFVP